MDINNTPENELEKDVINLLDESGQEHEFEIIDALEYKDQQYMAMIPIYDDPGDSLDDSGELVILKVSDTEDEAGEQYLEAIMDEEEYDAVAALFMDRLADEFDFEEDDGDGDGDGSDNV